MVENVKINGLKLFFKIKNNTKSLICKDLILNQSIACHGGRLGWYCRGFLLLDIIRELSWRDCLKRRSSAGWLLGQARDLWLGERRATPGRLASAETKKTCQRACCRRVSSLCGEIIYL